MPAAATAAFGVRGLAQRTEGVGMTGAVENRVDPGAGGGETGRIGEVAAPLVGGAALRREALDDLRPFLAADGGDITLEEVTADGIARVRLHGACCGCAMSPMTMKAGVEEAIKRVAPSIKSVEAVNMGEVV